MTFHHKHKNLSCLAFSTMSDSCEWQHGILDFGQILAKFRFLASIDGSLYCGSGYGRNCFYILQLKLSERVRLTWMWCTAHNFDYYFRPKI